MSFKSCFVPKCPNTNYNSNKLFIIVPRDVTRRTAWFATINKHKLTKSMLYCCEDHFHLSNDAENWTYYETVGQRLKLKKDVVPHLNLKSPVISDSQISLSSKKRKLAILTYLHDNNNRPRCNRDFLTCSCTKISDRSKTLRTELTNSYEAKTSCIQKSVAAELVDDIKTEISQIEGTAAEELIDIKIEPSWIQQSVAEDLIGGVQTEPSWIQESVDEDLVCGVQTERSWIQDSVDEDLVCGVRTEPSWIQNSVAEEMIDGIKSELAEELVDGIQTETSFTQKSVAAELTEANEIETSNCESLKVSYLDSPSGKIKVVSIQADITNPQKMSEIKPLLPTQSSISTKQSSDSGSVFKTISSRPSTSALDSKNNTINPLYIIQNTNFYTGFVANTYYVVDLLCNNQTNLLNSNICIPVMRSNK